MRISDWSRRVLFRSSVAVVVLIMSLASHGLIEPSLAYALVLGANLGTAVNPLLEGAGNEDPAARRLPLGNLGTRLAGCVLALILLPWLPGLMNLLTSDSARAVANFHTLRSEEHTSDLQSLMRI